MEAIDFDSQEEACDFSPREVIHLSGLSRGHVVRFVTVDGATNRFLVENGGRLWTYGYLQVGCEKPIHVKVFRQWHPHVNERPVFQSIEQGEHDGPIFAPPEITLLELGKIEYSL